MCSGRKQDMIAQRIPTPVTIALIDSINPAIGRAAAGVLTPKMTFTTCAKTFPNGSRSHGTGTPRALRSFQRSHRRCW
jgi:hypothetical protein